MPMLILRAWATYDLTPHMTLSLRTVLSGHMGIPQGCPLRDGTLEKL